jgi:hypothetical protein
MVLCLAYAFMLSLRRQLCGGERIFMGAQREEKADSQQTTDHSGTTDVFTSARAFALGHRNVLAVVTVSAITAAVIIPYIAQAGIGNFANVVTGQPVSQDLQPAKDVSEVNQQEQKTEQPASQQTPGNTSNTNNSTTNVTVNGQQVPVPENGTYSKTTEDGNSRTEIKVESKRSSTSDDSSSSNSSSVHLNVHSESSSSSSD